MTVLAPAKLTVSLRVTGVRADGYHELDAEMVSLSLADELVLTDGGSGLAVVAEPGTRAEALEGAEDNLIGRALAACGRVASVRLTKRIPVGGGLGGGSADAAAVLRWAGCADPDVAARLGADVPFCVVGGRARVEGVGELVTPLPFEPRDYLLVLPPFGVDTAPRLPGLGRGQPGRGRGSERADGRRVGRRATPGAVARRPGGPGGQRADAGGQRVDLVRRGWPGGGTASAPELRVGTETARLVRARTVPAGWDGD